MTGQGHAPKLTASFAHVLWPGKRSSQPAPGSNCRLSGRFLPTLLKKSAVPESAIVLQKPISHAKIF